jgi:hypothetical protein
MKETTRHDNIWGVVVMVGCVVLASAVLWFDHKHISLLSVYETGAWETETAQQIVVGLQKCVDDAGDSADVFDFYIWLMLSTEASTAEGAQLRTLYGSCS